MSYSFGLTNSFGLTANNVLHAIERIEETRVVVSEAQLGNDVGSVEATSGFVHFHVVHVHMVLLEADARSKVNVACNFVHFQKSVNSAALVLLLLNFLRKAFASALCDAVGVGERPACLAVCFAHFLARVAALLVPGSVAAPAIFIPGVLARYRQCSVITNI